MRMNIFTALSKMARALSKSDVFFEHAHLLNKFEVFDGKVMIYIVKMSVFIKSTWLQFDEILFSKTDLKRENVTIT